MTRIPDWLEAMQAVQVRWRETRYERLHANCLLYVRDVVQAITGEDPLQRIGFTFDEVVTERGFLRCIATHSGVAGIVDAVLGERIPLLCARRGDVALMPGIDNPAVGIVDGATVIYLHHEQGLTARSLAEAQAAWRVG